VLTRSEKKNSYEIPLSFEQPALQPKHISSKKRKLGEEDPPPSPAREAIVLHADPPCPHSSTLQNPPPVHPHYEANETYWDSSEARNLFRPTVEESNSLEAVKNQIKLLHEGLKMPTSCLYLIADFKANDNQKITKHQIWTLQQKCMAISLALLKATEMMENVKNWDFCCKTAIAEVAKQFLDQNKDICLSIQQYARENLHKLSIEFLSEYLHDVILPKMVKESYALEPNSEGYEQSLLELLKKYNLTCRSTSMIARWMEKLGFKYEQQKKGYYIDGHEKPATIEYRKAFVQ
jgi:hypothetical protein